MSTKLLLEYANFTTVAILAMVLLLMAWRRSLAKFSLVAAFLGVELMDELISIPVLFFRRATGLSLDTAYAIYFYSHWAIVVVESVLIIGIIYSVFRQAIRPLAGLHRIGKIIFRWVGGVAMALSVAVALGPHLFTSSFSSAAALAFTTVMVQAQQGINVLTLCLLLFVCFSTKALGLTYRSRTFGVSLGLGVFSTVQLVQAAWYAVSQAHSVYSPIYLVSCLGNAIAYTVWGMYFAIPEPERKMILLPTTSPFFFWNRLSEALGDEPGQVAIAGFKPDMLAPGELKVLTAMSRAARQREMTQAAGLDLPAGVLQTMAR